MIWAQWDTLTHNELEPPAGRPSALCALYGQYVNIRTRHVAMIACFTVWTQFWRSVQPKAVLCISLYTNLFFVGVWFVSRIPSVWDSPVILWKDSLFVDFIFGGFQCVFYFVWFKVLKSILLGDEANTFTQCSQSHLRQLIGLLISDALQAGRRC